MMKKAKAITKKEQEKTDDKADDKIEEPPKAKKVKVTKKKEQE